MSATLRSLLVTLVPLLLGSAALADEPTRVVVFRAGGEGLPGTVAEDVETATRARLEQDARVHLISREETREGVATGLEVGVACGAADLECYRKLAVLVEANELLLLRLLPSQGGLVLELTRADVGTGEVTRRLGRRLLVDTPVEAPVAAALDDALLPERPPERIAVVPFADGGSGLLRPVEERVREALQARADLRLAEDGAVAAALAQSDGCEGLKPQCLAAVGARVGAVKVVYGSLREGEGTPTAGVHVLDVVALTQRSTIGDVDGLREEVPAAVAHLFDDEGAPTPLAARAPTGAETATGALFMAGAGGALLVVGGASVATGLLLGGGGPARAEGAPEGARAAVTLAVPALAVGSGLVAGSLLWLGTTLTQE